MSSLYLARHGETAWSATGQHTGRTDLELTEQGADSAGELGTRLAGIPFDAVFTSPMRRARRTAELAGFPEAVVTDLLREFDYGEYEGRTTAEIQAERPGWDLFRDGCPGGETPGQVYARAEEFVALAGASGERVLAFAHGHIMRTIVVAYVELDVTVAGRLGMDTASITILQASEAYGRRLMVLNWLDKLPEV